MALNYASALDLVTTNYFLLRYVTEFSPTNVQHPNVDCRSIIDLANLHLYRLLFPNDHVEKTTISYLVKVLSSKGSNKLLPYGALVENA
jgi:endo-1,4-beta-mannosidase